MHEVPVQTIMESQGAQTKKVITQSRMQRGLKLLAIYALSQSQKHQRPAPGEDRRVSPKRYLNQALTSRQVYGPCPPISQKGAKASTAPKKEPRQETRNLKRTTKFPQRRRLPRRPPGSSRTTDPRGLHKRNDPIPPGVVSEGQELSVPWSRFPWLGP